jgi:hypothetical protein
MMQMKYSFQEKTFLSDMGLTGQFNLDPVRNAMRHILNRSGT